MPPSKTPFILIPSTPPHTPTRRAIYYKGVCSKRVSHTLDAHSDSGRELLPSTAIIWALRATSWNKVRKYPLRRKDYQNNSVNIFSCNCPGAITGFSCRAPENNSPKIVSCMGPCPVRAPPVIAPGALTGFSLVEPPKIIRK